MPSDPPKFECSVTKVRLTSVNTVRPLSCLGRTPKPASHMRAAKTQALREGCANHWQKWKCQSGFLILHLHFCFSQTNFEKIITLVVERPLLQSFRNHWAELMALSCHEDGSMAFKRNLQHSFGIPKQIYKACFSHTMYERNWIMVLKPELFSFVPKVQNMESFPAVHCFSNIFFFWVTLLFIFTAAFSVTLITRHLNTLGFIIVSMLYKFTQWKL